MTPPVLPFLEGSAFFDWDSLVAKQTAVGAYRSIVDARIPTMERFEMHATTLLPGKMSHPPHHHPQEELIFVRDGTLESDINGRIDRAFTVQFR